MRPGRNPGLRRLAVEVDVLPAQLLQNRADDVPRERIEHGARDDRPAVDVERLDTPRVTEAAGETGEAALEAREDRFAGLAFLGAI